ncbi:hypothetical protein [Haloarchaeobius sp. DFWS5]|uniref:DUF7827 domain-containing protein n=1 Tax=Haloarchaeobius sp. DFWS5 TaxID=3446114 RepID=UPI003EBC5F97
MGTTPGLGVTADLTDTGGSAVSSSLHAVDATNTTPWGVPETVVDQPGDPVTVPVDLGENASRATVRLGNESVGYRLVTTVADEDGDGRVTLRWNTHYAGVVPETDLERVLSVAGPDRLVAANRETPNRTEHLPQGRYTVTVFDASNSSENDTPSSGDDPSDGSPAATGTVVLEVDHLRAQSMRILEGPPRTTAADAYAFASPTSDVERDEWLFVEVNDTSVHGYIDNASALADPGTEGVSLHVQQLDGGPAVDVENAEFLHFPERDLLVLGFAPNTTNFEPDSTYRATFTVAESNPYAVTTEEVTQRFTMLPGGSQPDAAAVEVVEVDAPGRVIEGRPANFSVALLNSGARVGNATITVTLGHVTVERTVTVFPQSRRVVTVSVDTAPLTEGKSMYTVRVSGGRAVVDGTVDIWLSDDEPNTSPTFAPRSSGQPGFGVVGVVVAVAVAVVSVVRRFDT